MRCILEVALLLVKTLSFQKSQTRMSDSTHPPPRRYTESQTRATQGAAAPCAMQRASGDGFEFEKRSQILPAIDRNIFDGFEKCTLGHSEDLFTNRVPVPRVYPYY